MSGKTIFPTPEQIRAARNAENLTQTEAAAVVYAANYKTWQQWELGTRTMPQAAFELFQLKTTWGLKKMTKQEILELEGQRLAIHASLKTADTDEQINNLTAQLFKINQQLIYNKSTG